MLNRYAVLLVAGAAIFTLDASAASAQDTTRTRPRSTQDSTRARARSTKRIPITKEAPGEVASTARVDTVTVYKTDTLRLQGKVDTVNVTKTETVTRVDTVMQPMLPQRLRQIGGFYIGLAGGSSLPAANFNDSDHPGWRIEVPVGIDPIGSPLGVRFNFGYSRYEPHSYAKPFLENASIMNFDGDLKLRLVHAQPYNKRVQVYGIGGATYNRFKNILENNNGVLSVGDVFATNGRFTTTDTDWHSGWGYNIGGGLEFGWGATNLFVESRYNRFSGENSKISHVPLVIGLSWY
jgi:opacity protein-like surface antigen